MSPNSITLASGKRYIPVDAPAVPLYMHREDREIGIVRAEDNAPTVHDLYDGGRNMPLNKQWQYYLIAINPGMELRYVAGILNYHLCFANGTGFGHPDPDEPRKANYILNEDLDGPLVAVDKPRTISRSVLTGVEYQSDAGNWYLILDMLNVLQNPPLKPGRSYPQTIGEIRPDDYMYLPRTHPQYFCAAANVTLGGRIFPWDHGAIYDWTGDGQKRTFFYHIARDVIKYPLWKLKKLAPGSPPPYPYTA